MRTRTRRPGRPSLLTEERIDAIVRATAVGAASALAAEAAGISRATLARWMARGRDAADAREAGKPADVHEDVYVDLHRRVHAARATMATRALARVLQAGAGSLVLEERVRTFTDPVDGKLVEERQVRYLRPDWRAAAWWLARVFPADYGPNAQDWDQVLDGFDSKDAAAEEGDELRFAALAERLAVTLAAQDTDRPGPVPAVS
jgi:transposase